jgi:DNA-binding NarL/FixJ family response regulator
LLADGESSANLDILSHRQREILELVVEGFTNAQIAKRLFSPSPPSSSTCAPPTSSSA